MFIGEFGCCIPLLYTYFTTQTKSNAITPEASILTRILARLPGNATGYTHVPAEDDSDEDEAVAILELDDTLSGWRMCWMWFPAFFDSLSIPGNEA